MIEKILDLLVSAWDTVTPIFIIQQTDSGVVLRCGIFNRMALPGIRWKIPLFETTETATTVVTTMRLQSQTLTTKDNKSVVITPIVKYSIKNVKPFLLDIWDAEDVLNDVTLGSVKHVVSLDTWEVILKHDIESSVLDQVRKETKNYGFKIHKITFADMGQVKSIRLITD